MNRILKISWCFSALHSMWMDWGGLILPNFVTNLPKIGMFGKKFHPSSAKHRDREGRDNLC